jgi:hypothetical protein
MLEYSESSWRALAMVGVNLAGTAAPQDVFYSALRAWRVMAFSLPSRAEGEKRDLLVNIKQDS